MSNLFLPTFNLKAGPVGWPVKKYPSFKTVVQTPGSNRGENRINLTPYPIWKFELPFEMLTGDHSQPSSAAAKLSGFLAQMRGQYDDFLYDDPYDDTVTGQWAGYGDGVSTVFQAQRALPSAPIDLLQTVVPTAVYIDGSSVNAGPQTSGNFWYCGIENFLYYSQQFSQAAWGRGGGVSSVTDNSVISPDGATNAASVVMLGSGDSSLYQNVLYGSTTDTWTFSVWLKLPSGSVATHIALLPVDAAFSYTIGGFGGTHAVTITSAWQRFSFTVPFQNQVPAIQVKIGNSTELNSQTVQVWGAQLERWASASSYVLTTAVAPVYNLGQIAFDDAPTAGSAVTFDAAFYYRCRFDEDEWSELQEYMYRLWELPSLKFRSVLL